MQIDVVNPIINHHHFNGNSRPYFVGIFPYIGLIYGRYLQIRILKWQLIIGMIIVIIIALNDDDFRIIGDALIMKAIEGL